MSDYVDKFRHDLLIDLANATCQQLRMQGDVERACRIREARDFYVAARTWPKRPRYRDVLRKIVRGY